MSETIFTKIIAGEIQTLDDLINLDKDTLESLPDFGPIMIESFQSWLSNERNLATIRI